MKYFNRLAMGTCYYPEHWDESLWLRPAADAEGRNWHDSYCGVCVE